MQKTLLAATVIGASAFTPGVTPLGVGAPRVSSPAVRTADVVMMPKVRHLHQSAPRHTALIFGQPPCVS